MRLHQGSLASLIHDILETWFGSWFTIDAIIHEVLTHRPDSHPASIRRAVERLRAGGAIRKTIGSDGVALYQVPQRTYLREIS